MPKNFVNKNVISSMKKTPKGTILRSVAVCIGIELGGSFITGKTGQRTTTKNFKIFCKSKYMPIAYHKIAPLLLINVRNGIAHSYIPKGGIIVTSDSNMKNYHLKFFSGGLCVYIPTLSEDVQEGLKKLMYDIQRDKTLQEKYHRVIQTVDKDGIEVYKKYITQNKISPICKAVRGDISVDL